VSPETLVARAIALGYSALGITDTADLGGIPRFVNAARLSGQLRPIVGAELRVDGRPAAFLVRTPEGYRNLAALVTRGRMGAWASWTKEHGQERRGRPNVTWREVAELSGGLVALTGPATGPIASLVRGGDRANARRLLDEWRDVRRTPAVEVSSITGGAEGALPAHSWTWPSGGRSVGRRARSALRRQRRPPHPTRLTALRYNVDLTPRPGRLPPPEWRVAPFTRGMARRWQDAAGIETRSVAAECGDFGWLDAPADAQVPRTRAVL
jgi:hypothetical protein